MFEFKDIPYLDVQNITDGLDDFSVEVAHLTFLKDVAMRG